jgi:hypothetical protein
MNTQALCESSGDDCGPSQQASYRRYNPIHELCGQGRVYQFVLNQGHDSACPKSASFNSCKTYDSRKMTPDQAKAFCMTGLLKSQ